MIRDKVMLPRRSFLCNVASTSLALMCSDGIAESNAKQNNKIIDWSHGMPPLFCTAYIDPGIKSQQNQEKNELVSAMIAENKVVSKKPVDLD